MKNNLFKRYVTFIFLNFIFFKIPFESLIFHDLMCIQWMYNVKYFLFTLHNGMLQHVEKQTMIFLKGAKTKSTNRRQNLHAFQSAACVSTFFFSLPIRPLPNTNKGFTIFLFSISCSHFLLAAEFFLSIYSMLFLCSSQIIARSQGLPR